MVGRKQASTPRKESQQAGSFITATDRSHTCQPGARKGLGNHVPENLSGPEQRNNEGGEQREEEQREEEISDREKRLMRARWRPMKLSQASQVEPADQHIGNPSVNWKTPQLDGWAGTNGGTEFFHHSSLTSLGRNLLAELGHTRWDHHSKNEGETGRLYQAMVASFKNQLELSKQNQQQVLAELNGQANHDWGQLLQSQQVRARPGARADTMEKDQSKPLRVKQTKAKGKGCAIMPVGQLYDIECKALNSAPMRVIRSGFSQNSLIKDEVDENVQHSKREADNKETGQQGYCRPVRYETHFIGDEECSNSEDEDIHAVEHDGDAENGSSRGKGEGKDEDDNDHSSDDEITEGQVEELDMSHVFTPSAIATYNQIRQWRRQRRIVKKRLHHLINKSARKERHDASRKPLKPQLQLSKGREHQPPAQAQSLSASVLPKPRPIDKVQTNLADHNNSTAKETRIQSRPRSSAHAATQPDIASLQPSQTSSEGQRSSRKVRDFHFEDNQGPPLESPTGTPSSSRPSGEGGQKRRPEASPNPRPLKRNRTELASTDIHLQTPTESMSETVSLRQDRLRQELEHILHDATADNRSTQDESTSNGEETDCEHDRASVLYIQDFDNETFEPMRMFSSYGSEVTKDKHAPLAYVLRLDAYDRLKRARVRDEGVLEDLRRTIDAQDAVKQHWQDLVTREACLMEQHHLLVEMRKILHQAQNFRKVGAITLVEALEYRVKQEWNRLLERPSKWMTHAEDEMERLANKYPDVLGSFTKS